MAWATQTFIPELMQDEAANPRGHFRLERVERLMMRLSQLDWCASCANRFTPGSTDFEHSRLQSKGGAHSTGNCRLWCKFCHVRKGEWDGSDGTVDQNAEWVARFARGLGWEGEACDAGIGGPWAIALK
jgi:hypothetical protein